MWKEIYILIRKDIALEWRHKVAINGILLYIACTVFICYLSLGIKATKLAALTWNALLWIILLFAAVNAVARTFIQEKKGRLLYYYSLVSPQAIILSKMIYNALLMLFLSLIALLFYSMVMGNPIQDMSVFLINVLLGSVGFSGTFTMISAIASKTENGHTLMTILGIPVIIPLLLVVMKISKNAIDGIDNSVNTNNFILLFSLNIMIGLMAYLLFPFLWKA